jgi:hypothetical protein
VNLYDSTQEDANYKILWPTGDYFVFEAGVSSFKPVDVDSDKPDILTCEIELTPTGSFTFEEAA